jgi:hypothetical protein
MLHTVPRRTIMDLRLKKNYRLGLGEIKVFSPRKELKPSLDLSPFSSASSFSYANPTLRTRLLREEFLRL